MNRSLKDDLQDLENLTDGRYRLDLVGPRLKAIRLSRDLSQYWFAARAGIREKAYWQYESGNGFPPIQKLVALANTHNFDLNDLFDPTRDPSKGDVL